MEINQKKNNAIFFLIWSIVKETSDMMKDGTGLLAMNLME